MRPFDRFNVSAIFVISGVALALGCSSGGPDDRREPDMQSDVGGSSPSGDSTAPTPRSGAERGVGASTTPSTPTSTGTVAAGEQCEADDECSTGYCADGVCCNSACNGTCESCDAPGQEGQCTPYAYGTDPESECPTPACYDALHERFVCDGASACQVEISECGSYNCDDEKGCYTECRTDLECADSAWCDEGRCAPK